MRRSKRLRGIGAFGKLWENLDFAKRHLGKRRSVRDTIIYAVIDDRLDLIAGKQPIGYRRLECLGRIGQHIRATHRRLMRTSSPLMTFGSQKVMTRA